MKNLNLIERAANRMQDKAARPAPSTAVARGANDAAPPLPVENAAAHPVEIDRQTSVLPAGRPHSVRASQSVVIDLTRLKLAGMITPDGLRSMIAEEFREVKRPLLANAFGRDPVRDGNLVMVTSAQPGEGKTFCAINLAMSIAQDLDHTVLLVDADVARPSVMRTLGIQAEEGLLDLVLDPSLEVSEVVLKTNIDRLSIIPPGRPHKRATELFASASMGRILDDLARRYPDRMIIIDAAPLLPATESRVLATRMGQILLVVEAGRTSHDAVRQAMQYVECCDVVLPILNKGHFIPSGGYYYGNRDVE